MNILALDLGTKCGYASAKNSGVFNLKPSTHESTGQRYQTFARLLREYMSIHLIDFVVYEEVHAHIGVEAAHVYGGLMAILQMICIERGVEYKGVSVQAIKKHATGKFNADKKSMVKSAVLKFPKINVIDDNHADALHLLDYAISCFHPQTALEWTP